MLEPGSCDQYMKLGEKDSATENWHCKRIGLRYITFMGE